MINPQNLSQNLSHCWPKALSASLSSLFYPSLAINTPYFHPLRYEHDNTSHVCRDVDECSRGHGGAPPCRGLAQCVNLPGAYECRCPPGYARTSSQDDCEDLDECTDEHLCEHGVCRNTIGSYRSVILETAISNASRLVTFGV